MTVRPRWRRSFARTTYARGIYVAAALGLAFTFVVLPAIGLVGTTVPSVPAPNSTVGTDFWVAFEGNYDGKNSRFLFIASATATSGSVSMPGASFTVGFSAAPGAPASVQLPDNAQNMTSDKVGYDAVHVMASDPVSVHGLSTEQYSSDGFLAIPSESLGTNYFVEAYTNYLGYGSQFEVVATQDATAVTVTPSETLGAHAAGVPYVMTLNAGQTYQLTDSGIRNGDLTGTRVSADKPIAVFAGNQCTVVPAKTAACNTLSEEMTSIDTWGHTFIAAPLATRSGDRFRVMAAQDNTVVYFDGVDVATINAGKYFETVRGGPVVISADKPVHVMKYSQSNSVDHVAADPFDVTVPPTAQYLNSYTVQTPPQGADPQLASNYINITAPTSDISQVRLDGNVVAAERFSPIPGSTFSGAQIGVAFGAHTVASPNPLGVTLYGFGTADGYGYPAGFTLASIATAINVSLGAPVPSVLTIGSSVCITATVTDQSNTALVNVRVDFTVAGVHPTSGFVYADSQGKAKFCYTGNSLGTDTITAAVDAVESNLVPLNWVQVAPASPAVTPTASPAPTTTPGPSPPVTPSPIPTAIPTPSPAVTESPLPSTTPTPGSCPSPRMDAVASAFGSPGGAALTSPNLSSANGGELVLAYVAVDGPFAPTQTVTSVVGGGLSWNLVSRANQTWGSTEVWQAYSATPVTRLTATANFSHPGYDGLITVAMFSGAGTRVGNAATAAGIGGMPSVTVGPTRCGSLVWGVGHDWSNDAPMTAGADQTLIRQFKDTRVHDSFWVQRYNEPTKQGQVVKLNITGPQCDRWTFAAVEIPVG